MAGGACPTTPREESSDMEVSAPLRINDVHDGVLILNEGDAQPAYANGSGGVFDILALHLRHFYLR
jgi:hypothetical protein